MGFEDIFLIVFLVVVVVVSAVGFYLHNKNEEKK
jgi:uncharacterized protein (UPF0333 family)